jgi:hypothetical protein
MNKNKKHKVRVVFSTYSAASNDHNSTAFLGVLKRCVRLIANMKEDLIEPHLVNFGSVPIDDPLLQKELPKLIPHNLENGSADIDFNEFFNSLKPDILVLGEGPGRGKMLDISKAALVYKIPQVCIENYYGAGQPEHFKKENPWLDQWLLLGLPSDYSYGRITEQATLCPPLLPVKDKITDEEKYDVVILGYDINAAMLGIELIHKLPKNIHALLIHGKSLKKHLIKLKNFSQGINVTFIGFPNETQFRNWLTAANIVVCKSGFQQMVECLAVGTPIIAYDARGGVPEILLSEPMRPFVKYFPKRNEGWSKLLIQCAFWLQQKPFMPWQNEIEKIKNPAVFASEKLYGIFTELLRKQKTHV